MLRFGTTSGRKCLLLRTFIITGRIAYRGLQLMMSGVLIDV